MHSVTHRRQMTTHWMCFLLPAHPSVLPFLTALCSSLAILEEKSDKLVFKFHPPWFCSTLTACQFSLPPCFFFITQLSCCIIFNLKSNTSWLPFIDYGILPDYRKVFHIIICANCIISPCTFIEGTRNHRVVRKLNKTTM